MQSPPTTDATGSASAQAPGGQVNNNTGAKPGSEVTETPKADDSAAKFAALARREKALARERAESKSREADREKQWEAKLQAQRSEIEQSYRSKLQQDTWGTLIEAGLTPEQVTQVMLNTPKPEDIKFQEMRRELDQLKKQSETAANQTQEQQKRSYEQARGLVSKEVALLVDGNDAFETIVAMGAQDAVVQLIEDTLNDPEQGYMMSAEDAAKAVEEYLVEKTLSYAKLKKVQAKLGTPLEEAQQQVQEKKPQSQTLSHSLKQQSSAQPMTQAEKRQRAILAFQGKLTT